MRLLTLLLLLASTFSFAKTATSIKKVKKAKFRQYTEKVYFNYFARFLGPSLSPEYQNGATYNRFKTGQDFKGDDIDATGSHQMFQSITLGYNIARDYKLSYGYTFQDDLNNDIKYKDSWGQTQTYSKGVSDNNKRINLSVYNVVNNDYFYINTNYFYEISSTINSVYQDMDYGLGFEPSIGFYNNNSALYTGMGLLIQRNYYKNNEILFEGNIYPTRYQTLLVQMSPYLSYKYDDYITLKSKLTFDWDKRGNQIDNTHEFNKNMDDTGEIGVDVLIDYGVTAGGFIEFALEEPELKKTAVGANLSISLF